jgi:hypothetical protein
VILLANSIHQIFADNTEDFVDRHHPNYTVLKVLNHIVSCRTPALGAAVYNCACGEQSFVYHSCRDRHCPVCQNINNARWADKQMESSLPVKYFHIVFTLPDILNPYIRQHPKPAYNALFEAASSALLKLSADRKFLGATPGFTAVLHTWGQTMQFHPHLHVIITAGGLTKDGTRFIDKSDAGYLLPVKVLSRLFRGIFIDVLNKKVTLPKNIRHSLYQTEFFCYMKEPMSCTGTVVKYLARYANRVCISDSRITEYNKRNNTVTFSYKDNKDEGKRKSMTLCAIEFIRRFLLHVLPKRFMKIRHYGILRNRGKFERIKHIRRLLNPCKTSPLLLPNACSFQAVCKKCGSALTLLGHWDALTLQRLMRLQLC